MKKGRETLFLCLYKIAAHMSLNRRYLSRIFKESTGKSLKEYLVEVRMREAKRLLTLGYNVNRAAQLCGYPDQFNFSKMFKHTYGVSPKGWCDSMAVTLEALL